MPQPNLRPKYLMGPPHDTDVQWGPYCCYNTNLKVVMVGAIGRGFGGSMSYRYYPLGILVTPVPHPRSLEYFRYSGGLLGLA